MGTLALVDHAMRDRAARHMTAPGGQLMLVQAARATLALEVRNTLVLVGRPLMVRVVLNTMVQGGQRMTVQVAPHTLVLVERVTQVQADRVIQVQVAMASDARLSVGDRQSSRISYAANLSSRSDPDCTIRIWSAA